MQNHNFKSPHLVWLFPGYLAAHMSSTVVLTMTENLRRMGWKVSPVTAGSPEQSCIDGVEVVTIRTPNIYMLRQIIFHLRFIRFLIKNWSSIDIVLVAQTTVPFLPFLKLVRWLKRTDLPLFIMDTRTVPMEDMRKASARDKLRATFNNWMNALANHWVAGQTAITQRMAELVKIPPEKLWGIWSSGVSLELFEPARSIRQWPKDDEPVHITYVGVLHYERNLMALCQAVIKANEQGMKYLLTLTGRGSQQHELKEFAETTHGQIVVNPAVPHDQVPIVLSREHVGVLPFPDEEKYRVSSPIKLYEYMASGLPIMATRIACHTDVIQDEGFVFWADDSSADGLLTALKNIWEARANLKQMGENAAVAAQSHTWEASAKKLSDALLYGLHSQTRHHFELGEVLLEERS